MEKTFGGYPVIIESHLQYTLVKCKGVTGELSQLERWYKGHGKDDFAKFYFGFGDKLSEIVITPFNTVKIACLEEDYNSFKNKVKQLISNVS